LPTTVCAVYVTESGSADGGIKGETTDEWLWILYQGLSAERDEENPTEGTKGAAVDRARLVTSAIQGRNMDPSRRYGWVGPSGKRRAKVDDQVLAETRR